MILHPFGVRTLSYTPRKLAISIRRLAIAKNANGFVLYSFLIGAICHRETYMNVSRFTTRRLRCGRRDICQAYRRESSAAMSQNEFAKSSRGATTAILSQLRRYARLLFKRSALNDGVTTRRKATRRDGIKIPKLPYTRHTMRQ